MCCWRDPFPTTPRRRGCGGPTRPGAPRWGGGLHARPPGRPPPARDSRVTAGLSERARAARAAEKVGGTPRRGAPAGELRLAAGLLLDYRAPETVLGLAEHSDDSELDALFTAGVVPKRLVKVIGELQALGEDHGLADRL